MNQKQASRHDKTSKGKTGLRTQRVVVMTKKSSHPVFVTFKQRFDDTYSETKTLAEVTESNSTFLSKQ